MTPRNLALSLAALVLLTLTPSSPCRAESRLESLSTDGESGLMNPELVEIDVMQKASLGLRSTRLGARDTHEIFVRVKQQEGDRPLDLRDQRSDAKGSMFQRSGIHVGLVGVDVDGTRGNPHSLRLGIFSQQRMGEKVVGIGEIGYQTGTFGGEVDRLQNSGGIRSTFGARYKLGKSLYGVTQYRFSPGVEREWVPEVRLGMSF